MIIKPTPGQSYTVVKGDTLWDIANAAYGNGRKWEIIYNANKSRLRDPTIYSSSEYAAIVMIYPGEILQIPPNSDKDLLKNELINSTLVNSKKEENIRFVLNGNEIKVSNARITCCLDTLADGFSFSGDAETLFGDKKFIVPFKYTPCDVYIDDTKIISGSVFRSRINSNATSGETLEVSGFSTTKHLIDSTSEPPYVYKDKTLKNIIDELGKLFSVKAKDTVNELFKFKKLKIEPNETIGNFILNLAYQRQVLLRSNTNNEIEIIRANVNAKPIMTITDGTKLVDPFVADFDGEKRFSKYVATGKRPKGCIKGIYKDDAISPYRVLFKKFDENDADEIKMPAEWMYRKALNDSIDMGFSIDSFYTDEGDLIRENNIVSMEKQLYFTKPGKKFLIKEVSFSQDINTGKKCEVKLTLPHIYTQEKINEDWRDSNV